LQETGYGVMAYYLNNIRIIGLTALFIIVPLRLSDDTFFFTVLCRHDIKVWNIFRQ